MKDIRQNRGSVLVEFIIVFPIYLVLFGGVFMIGDMLIKTTRLASADRTRAFDVAATVRGGENADDSLGWPRIKDYLFPITSIREDNVRNDWYRHYANPNFEGRSRLHRRSGMNTGLRLGRKDGLHLRKTFLPTGRVLASRILARLADSWTGEMLLCIQRRRIRPSTKTMCRSGVRASMTRPN